MVGRGGLGGGLGEGRVSYFGYSAKDDLESLGRGTRFHEILTDDRTPALALWRRSGEPGRRPPEMHPTLRQRRSLDDDRVGSRRKGPRRVRLVHWFWRPDDGAPQGWYDELAEGWRATMAEDMGVCAEVQRNLDAGIYRSGVLSLEREPGTIFFQSLVREAMAAAA